jgi:hypothetical protein
MTDAIRVRPVRASSADLIAQKLRAAKDWRTLFRTISSVCQTGAPKILKKAARGRRRDVYFDRGACVLTSVAARAATRDPKQNCLRAKAAICSAQDRASSARASQYCGSSRRTHHWSFPHYFLSAQHFHVLATSFVRRVRIIAIRSNSEQRIPHADQWGPIKWGFACVLRLVCQSICLRVQSTLSKVAGRSSAGLSKCRMATGYHCRLEKP